MGERILFSLDGASTGVRGGVAAADVRVRLSKDYDRRSHPTDERISSRWAEKLAAANGRRLFDKSKFRLEAITWMDEAKQGVVRIDLGLTCYKDYIGASVLHMVPCPLP
jgi:hypothetical protein